MTGQTRYSTTGLQFVAMSALSMGLFGLSLFLPIDYQHGGEIFGNWAISGMGVLLDGLFSGNLILLGLALTYLATPFSVLVVLLSYNIIPERKIYIIAAIVAAIGSVLPIIIFMFNGLYLGPRHVFNTGALSALCASFLMTASWIGRAIFPKGRTWRGSSTGTSNNN